MHGRVAMNDKWAFAVEIVLYSIAAVLFERYAERSCYSARQMEILWDIHPNRD
jgi:hypothetical protein